MSESSKMNFHELMSLYKEYNDTFEALYTPRTNNEEMLDKICNDIKINLINTKYFEPSDILKILGSLQKYNNRYDESYWYIFKKIYEEFRPDHINGIPFVFDYRVYKEYGIWLNQRNQKLSGKLKIVKPSAIIQAIMNDDIVTFKSFTEREDFDKNDVLDAPIIFEKTNLSLLEACCYYGATKCFSLLREKFDLEITKRCLKLSILNGNYGLVKECLKVVEPDDDCMENAIILHNIALVTFLMIEYELTINLYYCGLYNSLQAFFVYLDQTNDIKKCFIYSPSFNILSLCQYFLDHGANINDSDCKNKMTALHTAARLNKVEIAEFLIKNGAIVNIRNLKGNTPLQLAAENNSKEMIEFLMMNGANIFDLNYDNKSALCLAAENDASDAAEVLILHGANVNETYHDEETVLHVAACLNKVEIAELLIKNGAIVNIRNLKGNTPLQLAAENNSKEMIEFLMMNGANISDRNNADKSALYLAAENDASDAAEALILHGANVNETYNYGETVLHIAAELNQENVASVLVSHGAIINAKEYENGSTALHKAAMKGNTNIVEILLSHGADVNSKDSSRKTALDYAKENGNEKIAELLISNGAIPNSMDN